MPPPRKGKDIANCIFKCLKEWDIENKKFAELAQQYNLKERRLVLECKTRWNSTYEMLDCAIKFKEDPSIPPPICFLVRFYKIKLLLGTSSKSSDDFVKGMVTNMKERETLYELYDEYVNLYSPPLMEQMGECGTSANVCGEGTRSSPELLEILQAVRREELTENRQYEVDLYLEEGCYIPQESKFDALLW
ncbi:hypothetical protein V6N11_034157 [Hibiscus sabdariffa]|uniref:Uncharacterized protein n=1 Tax=Hibiscus sabdariffa TaxID=183260 RepID=A0ABR2S262_9ROSI